MKAKHTDAILLFRTADFYTSLGDDAEDIAELEAAMQQMSEYIGYPV